MSKVKWAQTQNVFGPISYPFLSEKDISSLVKRFIRLLSHYFKHGLYLYLGAVIKAVTNEKSHQNDLSLYRKTSRIGFPLRTSFDRTFNNRRFVTSFP